MKEDNTTWEVYHTKDKTQVIKKEWINDDRISYVKGYWKSTVLFESEDCSEAVQWAVDHAGEEGR